MNDCETFRVVRAGRKWELVSTSTGRVLGTHDTQAEARAQQRAVYAAKHRARRGDGNALLFDKLETLWRGGRGR